MALRVLAITAPQFACGEVGSMALTSGDPVSLQNACRYAASLAGADDPVWADSNWNAARSERQQSVLLLHDMASAEIILRALLPKLRPHVVFIGAMSICMRGAVEVATIIRQEMGDHTLIVLGGRHASETTFVDAAANVIHHPASPLRLMAGGRIANVFDVVIAGDGEAVIAEIGRAVARMIRGRKSVRAARFDLSAITDARGRWLAGTVDGDVLRVVRGTGGLLDHTALPSPVEIFGVKARFSTFGGVPTAHVFSDIGGGCIFSCGFCSEGRHVVGAPRDFGGSPARLFRNLKRANEVIRADFLHVGGASAFCEDSTFLGWKPDFVNRFAELAENEPLAIRFGGQATIDQIINAPELAARLRTVGLEYLFVGVETPVPDLVGGFHKDRGKHDGSWLERASRAFGILASAGIKVGVSLLFGMGEGRHERDVLFKALERWRGLCEIDTISMNWAVQHPLKNQDSGLAYEYLAWPVEPGPLLDVLRHFGEASTNYPVKGGHAPSLSEARDIVAAVECVRVQHHTKPAA